MYKTTYQLTVGDSTHSTTVFVDDAPTVGAASAALAQIKACRDVDSVIPGDNAAVVMIIPYHAIEYAMVEPTRTEVEDPTDDTCITDDDEEGD